MVTPNKILINLHLFSSILIASISSVLGQHYSSNIRCLDKERQALLKFKEELVDEYGRLSSWGVGENKRECCKWIGVRCHNRSNHVSLLSLRGPSEIYYYYSPYSRTLKGKISSSLLELKHLTYLDLSHIDFSYSNIPEFIGSFEELQYLNLFDTNFSKSIPTSVGNLSKLIYLDFSGNYYLHSENLDWVSHLGSLKYLDLSGVRLESASNWLQAISKLSSIKELHFVQCELQDIHHSSLPLINSSAPLAILDLSSNAYISSSIFQWFLNFSKCLTFVDIKGNNLTDLTSAYTFDDQIFLAHLDLSYNNIESGIPKSLGNTSNLMYLNLGQNQLSAQLSELMMNLSGPMEKKLQYLDLSGNMISGSLPNFSRFSFLRVLDLHWNELDGSIANGFLPNCVANCTNLEYLNLANNHFVGEIPISFGSLERLVSLNLRNNSLSGGIPTSFRNCKRLQLIDLGENMLTGNIPSWIGDVFSKLIVLSLNLNKFNGTIPSSICSLQYIQILDLSSNMISGPIPKCLHNLSAMTKAAGPSEIFFENFSEKLFGDYFFLSLRDGASIMWKGKEVKYVKGLILVKLIDMSDNLLVGDIPSEITKLHGLVILNLSENYLRGQIPPNISHLKDLNSLDLSRNHLSGSIPIGISELSSLGFLNLSYNNLSGSIPPNFLRFDEYSYAGNPGLCGRLILNKSCPGEIEINHQDPSINNDGNAMNNWEHEDDKLITKGFYICMVFGFVIGFWGIFGTILLNRSARFAYFKLLNTIGDFIYVRVELNKARLRKRFKN